MTPKEIVAKFSHSHDNFYPIVGKPSDSDLTRLREVVAPFLLQIPYDETDVVHNRISLIRPEAAYIARYVEAFPEPTIFGAYDTTIDDDAMSVIRARTEAAHKENRAERATAVVADTWVR